MTLEWKRSKLGMFQVILRSLHNENNSCFEQIPKLLHVCQNGD